MPTTCSTRKLHKPNLNYPNEKRALYCKSCKLEDMIDILHKKCITCNIKHPIYNYPNETQKSYCKSCKLEKI